VRTHRRNKREDPDEYHGPAVCPLCRTPIANDGNEEEEDNSEEDNSGESESESMLSLLINDLGLKT
jgi:hypothetical protein